MPRSLRDPAPRDRRTSQPLSSLRLCLLLVAFLVLGAWILGPALEGSFLSDDHTYIVNNPYVHELSLANASALLDPWGPPAAMTLNYAPVHLFVHAIEWRLFGPESLLGWHLVNVAGHALVSVLLVLFFVRAGIPAPAAVGGGAFFLVHPANVETVAWIFQLKTILSLALALAALLLHARRPGWAALLFALALLAKITALAALPVACVQAWLRSAREPPRWGWLGVWVALALAIAIPELAAFREQADPRLEIRGGVLVHARTIFAIGMRYLVMAVTGRGTSAFHEPAPVQDPLDAWWLGGLAAFVLIGWRTLHALGRRREEAACWIFAVASFAPVSQVFPFLFPMGDRYLYPILPGLIGAVVLAALPGYERVAERVGRPLAARAVALGAVGVIAVLAARSEGRAAVYRDDATMMMDAAIHYPRGMIAQFLRARGAAREGRGAEAARAMATVVERGFGDLSGLLLDPDFASLRRDPAFSEVLRRLARYDVEKLAPRADLEAFQRLQLAIAYEHLDQPRQAIAALEPALGRAGPFEPPIRALHRALERSLALAPGDPEPHAPPQR